MFILGAILVVIAILLISVLIDSILCLGVLILLIALAIVGTFMTWFVKSEYWPFKKKLKESKDKQGEPQENVSETKEEGQNNE